MATVQNDLYTEFLKVADRGDEQEAKDFLLANLKRFPQDDQDAIVAAFFDDALKTASGDARAVAEFQKEGLRAAEKLEQLKAELQKKAKLLEAKE
jgi:hypothetical protein